jgi:hypothetical protein
VSIPRRGLGKLLQAGAKYLRHAQAVRSATRLPEDQMQARLAEYLQRLEPGELGGFRMSITAEALREKDPRLKQVLSWVVSNTAALRDGRTQVNAPPTDLARPAPPTLPNVDDTLVLLNEWWELDETEAEKRLASYVDLCSEGEFRQFVTNLEQARENIRSNLEQAEADEANAWGRFSEDRIAYMLAKARTGARDPEHERRIRELDRSAAFVERIRDSALQRRQKADDCAASEPADTDGGRLDIDEMFAQLEAIRQDSLARGDLRPERDLASRAWLEEIRNVMTAKERGEISAAHSMTAMQDIMGKRKDMIVDAGPALDSDFPPDCRAAVLVPRVQGLKEFAMSASMTALSGNTHDAVVHLYTGVARALQELRNLRGDEMALGYEQTEIRPLAQEATRLALMRHQTIAFPIWDSPHVASSANTVFYSGAPDLGDLVCRVATTKRLQVKTSQQARYYGQARWDQLRASFVAVFDWRSYRRAPGTSPDVALASVAYELGLALTLGKPVVIIGGQDGDLPFDIDIDPVRLGGGRVDDVDVLADAVDDAVYGVQRVSDESCLAATLDQLSELAAETTRPGAIKGMGWLDPDNVRDPLAFNTAARNVVREAGRGEVLTPAWPTKSSAGTEKTLFHVTPFSAEWSNAVRATVWAACRDAGVRHSDGETVQDARILRRIWDGISGADLVLVDATDLNPNVMIELGMAHALGRETRIVHQVSGRNRGLQVRNLEKIEVRGYGDTSAELHSIIVDWVRTAG